MATAKNTRVSANPKKTSPRSSQPKSESSPNMPRNAIHIAEASPQQSAIRTQYKRIADFINQLKPFDMYRMIELRDRAWTPEIFFRIIGHLNGPQRDFINELETTTVDFIQLLNALNLATEAELKEFLDTLDRRLITAGVHPSEIYHVHYALNEDDTLETEFELASEFEQFLIHTCVLQFQRKPAWRIARAFFDYCHSYSVFRNTEDELSTIWRSFLQTAEYVIGPHRFHKDAIIKLPDLERRRARVTSLVEDLVPLLRAAAVPIKGKDFNVPQAIRHDFTEAMQDDYIYRALFMPALPALAEQS